MTGSRRKKVRGSIPRHKKGAVFNITKRVEPNRRDIKKIGKQAAIDPNLFDMPYIKELLARTEKRKRARRLESIIRSRELFFSVISAKKRGHTYGEIAVMLNERHEYTPRGLPWNADSLNRFTLRYQKIDGAIGQTERVFSETEHRLVQLANLFVPSLYIADVLNLERRWTRQGNPWNELAINRFLANRKAALKRQDAI